MAEPVKHFFVTSLVASKTLGPAVQIELDTVKTQVSAEKAREMALMILEAAEAAMSDAFLVHFIVEKTGVPLDAAVGMMLSEFRAYRDTEREKQFREDKG